MSDFFVCCLYVVLIIAVAMVAFNNYENGMLALHDRKKDAAEKM